MEEKSAGDVPPGHNEETHSPLTFEQRVAHLTAGYDNSQSSVRFLDTKAAATIGAVPVVLGVLAAVFNWLQKSWQWDQVADQVGLGVLIGFATCMVILAVLLLVFAWVTVCHAFGAITPRDVGDTAPSILFPYETPPAADKSFAARVEVFTGTPEEADAIEDFRRQVLRMSQIVAQKLGHVNKAIRYLTRVFTVAFLALGLMLLMAGYFGATASYRIHYQLQNMMAKGATAPAVSASTPPAGAQTRP